MTRGEMVLYGFQLIGAKRARKLATSLSIASCGIEFVDFFFNLSWIAVTTAFCPSFFFHPRWLLVGRDRTIPVHSMFKHMIDLLSHLTLSFKNAILFVFSRCIASKQRDSDRELLRCEDNQQNVPHAVDRRCSHCNAQNVRPAYKKYLENPDKSVEEWMGQSSLKVPGTVVALVGLPKCGKSTMLNQFVCVIALALISQLVSQGGGAGDGRHNTLRQCRINLMEKAYGATGRRDSPFELTMCDLVGVRCLRELWCALLGKTENREMWPVHPGMSADEKEQAIREVEERESSPFDAVHCIVLVMTPETLFNMADETKDVIAGILRGAKEFRPNTDDDVEPFELPLRLVVKQRHGMLIAHS